MKNIILMVVLAAGLSGCTLNNFLALQEESPNEQVQFDTEFDTIELTGTDGGIVKHYLFETAQTPKATLFVLPAKTAKVSDWNQYIRPLTDHGFQVFMMAYRGMSERNVDEPHFGVVSDTVNAINYLASRSDINKLPLVLLGQAYGGQPAIYAAHIKYAVVDALILEGAFTSFSENEALTSYEFLSSYVAEWFPNIYSGVELIEHVKLPTLIIHSKDDQVVPFSMGETLKNTSGNPTTELWEIDGNHLEGLQQRPDEYVQKIEQLINVGKVAE